MKTQEFIYGIRPEDIETIKNQGFRADNAELQRYSDSSKNRLFILFDLARLIRDKKIKGVKLNGKIYSGDVLSQDIMDKMNNPMITGEIDPKYIKMYNPDSNKWRMVDANGYARVYDEKPTWKNYTQFVYEHRDVIEKVLKRKLETKEVIHHVNARRDYNPDSNLELVRDKHQHVLEKHPEWIKKKR